MQRLLLTAWIETGANTYVVDRGWGVDDGCKFTGQPAAGVQSDDCSRIRVKFTPVQELRLCTGRTAHRGSRSIALLFHDHGTRRG